MGFSQPSPVTSSMAAAELLGSVSSSARPLSPDFAAVEELMQILAWLTPVRRKSAHR
jgi:hypothetical protein